MSHETGERGYPTDVDGGTVAQVMVRVAELEAENRRLRDELDRTAALADRMHAAAVGSGRGPTAGLVEDMVDDVVQLRSDYVELMDLARDLARDVEDLLALADRGRIYYRCDRCGEMRAAVPDGPTADAPPDAFCDCWAGPDWVRGLWNPRPPAGT